MTPTLEFLACELGKVSIALTPCTRGGYEAQLRADGIDEEAEAKRAADAVAMAAAKALASYRARFTAVLRQAESSAEGARETIAAIDELMGDATGCQQS